jgi:hypothetical protein
MKSSKWLVNLRLTTPAAPASHVAGGSMPCSAGQANADEWFGILVAHAWLVGWELGICKIFETFSILGGSRRIIPTEPVLEAGGRQSAAENARCEP